MAQSLSNLLVHLLFSTKERSPWLADVTHRRFDFQTEFRKLLEAQGVAYAERYAWE